MLKKTLGKLIVLFCKVVPKKEKKIVYHSFPDFSDNSFALFVYISSQFPEYMNIWLIKNISLKDKYLKLASNYTNTSNLLIVKKNSFKGFFYYLTTKTIFHTHGIFNFFGLNSKQKKINLWHGMPIKKVGYLDKPDSKDVLTSDYHVATSSFYQDLISKIFRASKEKVLVVGQTRNDFLLDNKFSIHQLLDNPRIYQKTVLWMPTYRKSVIGDIRVDGDINPEIDFFSAENLSKINEIFKKVDSICYFKIHPMDYIKVEDFKTYTNINFIDNSNFEEKGISMYSILNSVDVLLTDFSSIYIDFLLLNKPIGFVFSDYEEFKNSRGFIFDNPQEYMPGEFITSIDKLENFLIGTIVHNNDNFIDERKKIKNLFHSHEKDFSKILFQKVFNNV